MLQLPPLSCMCMMLNTSTNQGCSAGRDTSWLCMPCCAATCTSASSAACALESLNAIASKRHCKAHQGPCACYLCAPTPLPHSRPCACGGCRREQLEPAGHAGAAGLGTCAACGAGGPLRPSGSQHAAAELLLAAQHNLHQLQQPGQPVGLEWPQPGAYPPRAQGEGKGRGWDERGTMDVESHSPLLLQCACALSGTAVLLLFLLRAC
jgi:hypothetical protein